MLDLKGEVVEAKRHLDQAYRLLESRPSSPFNEDAVLALRAVDAHWVDAYQVYGPENLGSAWRSIAIIWKQVRAVLTEAERQDESHAAFFLHLVFQEPGQRMYPIGTRYRHVATALAAAMLEASIRKNGIEILCYSNGERIFSVPIKQEGKDAS